MTDELKPCPFCGGEAQIADETQWIRGKSNGGMWKYIYCKKCSNRTASYIWDDKKLMIESWNRRINND